MNGRNHHHWHLKSSILLCLLYVASTLSFVHAADFSFRHEGNLPYEPFSLQWGSDIPPELLAQLTARAEFNRTMAKKFKCSEEIYRDNSGIKVFDYLLHEPPKDRQALANDVEPLRFKENGERKADFSDSIPPAFAWSYLFSGTYQSNFTYRYLGESVEGYRPAHRIAFRGIRRFDKGTDIREWEGIAIVDAGTHEIIRIEAAPRNFAPIVEYQRRKYQMSFKFVGIRLRKKPRVYVLNIDFSETPIGADLSHSSVGDPIREEDAVMRLPNRIVWQEYRMNASGGVFRKRTEERRYLDYRFFDVEAREPKVSSFAGE
jgi:hypothetical protein